MLIECASTHPDNQRGGAAGKEHQPEPQCNAQLEGGNNHSLHILRFHFALMALIKSFGNHDAKYFFEWQRE